LQAQKKPALGGFFLASADFAEVCLEAGSESHTGGNRLTLLSNDMAANASYSKSYSRARNVSAERSSPYPEQSSPDGRDSGDAGYGEDGDRDHERMHARRHRKIKRSKRNDAHEQTTP
jgi:hypothetical protein